MIENSNWSKNDWNNFVNNEFNSNKINNQKYKEDCYSIFETFSKMDEDESTLNNIELKFAKQMLQQWIEGIKQLIEKGRLNKDGSEKQNKPQPENNQKDDGFFTKIYKSIKFW